MTLIWMREVRCSQFLAHGIGRMFENWEGIYTLKLSQTLVLPLIRYLLLRRRALLA